MANIDPPPEFVAAEAWRVIVRHQQPVKRGTPSDPAPIDTETDATAVALCEFWEDAWKRK